MVYAKVEGIGKVIHCPAHKPWGRCRGCGVLSGPTYETVMLKRGLCPDCGGWG